MDANFLQLRSGINTTCHHLRADIERCEARLATSVKVASSESLSGNFFTASLDYLGVDLYGHCSDTRRESTGSEQGGTEGQSTCPVEGVPVLSTEQSCLQIARREGMSTGPADSLVKWWSNVEEIGPIEFAKRANKLLRGARSARTITCKEGHPRAKISPSAGANVMCRLAWLDAVVQRIAKDMERLASSPQTNGLLLPRLTKNQLKQVEDLAVMYHLELGPAKGKSNSKALYVTAQTAELSTGGMLQLEAFLERFRPETKPRRKRPRPGEASADGLLEEHSPWMQSESKGGQMLKALGWKEGQGIGSRQQGILEPVLPRKRKHLLGLGAE